MLGSMRRHPFSLSISIAAVLLTGCGTSQSPAGAPSLSLVPGRQKIQHIVIVIQENRSLNNLFYGFPGATTVAYGYNSEGHKIALKPVTLATMWDLSHGLSDFLKDCNGTGKLLGTHCRMNGFNLEYVGCDHSGTGALTRIRPTATSPTLKPSPTSLWAKITSWPIRCTHRISTPAASFRTSTSSPAKRT